MFFASSLVVVALFGVGCGANQTASNTTGTTARTNTVAATGVVKEFTITAQQFAYSPNSITVKAGDTVKLHLTTADVTHGFSLPEFNVSATLTPGKTTDVEFVADSAGTYTYSCNLVCGAGHAGMKGTLIVQ